VVLDLWSRAGAGGGVISATVTRTLVREKGSVRYPPNRAFIQAGKAKTRLARGGPPVLDSDYATLLLVQNGSRCFGVSQRFHPIMNCQNSPCLLVHDCCNGFWKNGLQRLLVAFFGRVFSLFH